ncbi:OpgC family protein [Magnetospirillum molischianum]|uniref:Putative OpgC protein n=1 Tax=Magnetospirillum molischianum DSM 120 TaxID=1150626 RepID=H8FP05_MAGML|nr:OpgC domain-containing protein [Magnetospirillum molischianum]CCG40093.1 putative OpgC protein [Magnetospirillum molischianum DSM 120]
MDKSRRDPLIDAVRGLALVMIFINHVPGNPLEELTSRNFGPSDATELFVFLAGYSAAIVYGRRMERDGLVRTSFRLWGRAFNLYVLHLFTLLLATAIAATASLVTADPHLLDWINLGPIFFDPVPTLIGVVTLGHQAGYFNILPLYILLMAAASVMLPLVKINPWAALAPSVGLYLAVQIGDLNFPNYPTSGTWFFNPMAWQMMFVIGLVCGNRARNGLIPVPYHPFVAMAAGLVIVVGLGMKLAGYYPSPDALPLPFFMFGQDKTFMTVPRLVHALALLYLGAHFGARAALRWLGPIGRSLEEMGRHGLLIFCTGSVFAILAQLCLFAIDADRLTAGAVVLAGLAGLMFLAKGRSWYLGVSRVEQQLGSSPQPSALPANSV